MQGGRTAVKSRLQAIVDRWPIALAFWRKTRAQWRRVDGLSGSDGGTGRNRQMRLLFGIIIGIALTVGGAYIVDTMSSPAAGAKMVNWDVVAKNLDTVTTLAREGWKKITG
jgi:hypothetical protein